MYKFITLIALTPFFLCSAEEIRVAVASQAKVKLAAVERVFTSCFPEDNVEVFGYPSDSKIPSQPVGLKSATIGVANRLSSLPKNADYFVAIENFIEESSMNWNDLALVSINQTQSLSSPTPIPAHLVALAKDLDITVGEAIKRTYKNRAIDPHDWQKEVEFGGVSRQYLLEEALFKALHTEELALLKENVALYPNFPKEGILFEDFFPILSDPELLQLTINLLHERYKDKNIDYVVGLESRGFILASVLAYKLNAGFIPVRKPGKLPGPVHTVAYEKEYGTDIVNLSRSLDLTDKNILIIDDLIATGGTAKAAINLVKLAGATDIEFASILEVKDLHGRQKLKVPTFNLLD